MDSAKLLPIGFGVGDMWEGDADSTRLSSHVIRAGGDFLQLSPLSYDIWWQARFRREPGELIEWVSGQGVPSPAAEVETLLSRGLLVVLRRDIGPFARDHRMTSAGLGGGRQGDGTMLVLGADTRPLLQVDPVTYLAWSLADGSTVGEIARQIAGNDSSCLERVLALLAEALPVLVAHGALIVDRKR
ncbi:hypothetical protein ACFVYA_10800 [Amycolatopsis sp. NPDC058278]|uniref:hypothetical protein n=1 Tax=Amycolatopsis sp. NPDC058278 TaxID=3346417 RepID=UPI0036DAC94B